jgi:hypothetical protein
MKNTLVDLHNHLMEMVEILKDDDLVGENLDEYIKRSLAVNEVSKTMVANATLMAKCADLYGIDTNNKIDAGTLPLIPVLPADPAYHLSKDRKSLLPVPKDKK